MGQQQRTHGQLRGAWQRWPGSMWQLLASLLVLALWTVTALAAVLPAAYRWDHLPMGGGGYVSALIAGPAGSGALYARTDVGGAYRWDAGQQRWRPLLDWLSAAQAGWLGVEALALDPANPAHLYMLAGTAYLNGGRSAILRSHDGGASFAITDVTSQFRAHGNGMGRQNGERLLVDPGSGQIVYAGTRSDGLFRSTDGGASWARLAGLDVRGTPNGNGISLLLADPASVAHGAAQRLLVGVSRYASGGPNLYRSDDGGSSFYPVAGAPGTLMPQRAALDNQGNAYLTYANGAGPHPHPREPEAMNRGQVWKYHFASGRWTELTPAGVQAAFSGISVDSSNPQRLLLSTISLYAPQGKANGDRVYLSHDGGAHWTDLMARGFALGDGGLGWIRDKAIHWAGTVLFDPDPRQPGAAWITSGNGVFRSADIEASPVRWDFTVAGLEETVPLNLVSVASGPVLSVIGDYDGFRHTPEGALIHRPEMGTTTGLAVADGQPANVARVGRALYTSADGGQHWRSATMQGSMGHVAWSADGAVLLHSPQDSTTSYRSHDRGGHWSAIRGLAVKNARPLADPLLARRFYVYDPADGSVLVSENGAASFRLQSVLPAGGSPLIRAVPGRTAEVWVALKEGGLVRSSDAAAQFSPVRGVRTCSAVGFGKAESAGGFPTVFIWGTVGTVEGLFRSTDAGASWVRVNDDAHQYGGPGDGQFVVGDMNHFGVVYMSTAGRGIVVGKP